NQYIILHHSKNSKVISTELPVGVNQNGFVQSGIVVDEKGKPLAGVVVSVPKAGNVVQTDETGRFMIGIIDDPYTLEFRYLGYKTSHEKSARNRVLRVSLVPDQSNLDEVVVIGYGTTTRRN